MTIPYSFSIHLDLVPAGVEAHYQFKLLMENIIGLFRILCGSVNSSNGLFTVGSLGFCSLSPLSCISGEILWNTYQSQVGFCSCVATWRSRPCSFCGLPFWISTPAMGASTYCHFAAISSYFWWILRSPSCSDSLAILLQLEASQAF